MVTVWTKERNQWLFQHGSESPKELYKLFCEAFPEVETTKTGVTNQRSRIGACARHNYNKESRKAKPLYSEQEKHGYIYIKIAQPSVWISKSKWVWLETHPWLCNEVLKNDQFIFLDGNKRNFSPENIEKVSAREIFLINSKGKLPIGKPDLVMNMIVKARLRFAILDQGSKYGLCSQIKGDSKRHSYRILKSEDAARTRKYYQKHKNDEGFMEKIREQQKKYNSQKSAKEKQKKYQHDWYMRKKEEKNGN